MLFGDEDPARRGSTTESGAIPDYIPKAPPSGSSVHSQGWPGTFSLSPSVNRLAFPVFLDLVPVMAQQVEEVFAVKLEDVSSIPRDSHSGRRELTIQDYTMSAASCYPILEARMDCSLYPNLCSAFLLPNQSRGGPAPPCLPSVCPLSPSSHVLASINPSPSQCSPLSFPSYFQVISTTVIRKAPAFPPRVLILLVPLLLAFSASPVHGHFLAKVRAITIS